MNSCTDLDVDRFLSKREVCRRLGISRSTLERRIKAGAFPVPIHVSVGRVGWLTSTVNAWIAAQIARAHRSPSPVLEAAHV